FSDPQSIFKIVEKVVSERWRASRFANAWARYGSSALSGVEHLRLLVGRDSAVDTLLGHFGSLKELERASFQELRQFLTRREAEAVIAGLSMASVVDTEEALS